MKRWVTAEGVPNIFPKFRRFTQFLDKLPRQTQFKTFEQVLEEQRLESLIQIIPRTTSASSQPSQSGVVAYPNYHEFFDYPYYEPHYATTRETHTGTLSSDILASTYPTVRKKR